MFSVRWSGVGVFRWARVGAMVLGAAACAVACLDRPLVATEPQTNNYYVDQVPTDRIDKIDLLLMIDNSISMADKQELLARAVPKLVKRFVQPICVDSEEKPLGPSVDAAGRCAEGQPEFEPIRDIHIGVITSSLGAHGAGEGDCAENIEAKNDRAHLLPTRERGAAVADYQNTGFLLWDPDQKYTPPGSADAASIAEEVAKTVRAAGEQGCGYESSLESWYRFLVDPAPPLDVIVENNRSVRVGVDEELLAQRDAFLRSDSLVAIVMLTDENDCSIRDDSSGYVVQQNRVTNDFSMWRGSAACRTNPNDPCCLSCGQPSADFPDHCPKETDPVCSTMAGYPTVADRRLGLDSSFLRCWDQKRRFGFDLLYPVERYVGALRDAQILNTATGVAEDNPLLKGRHGKSPRAPDLVFLAGVVGVPWQDIATRDSLTGEGLRYLDAAELAREDPELGGKTRWELILGKPGTETEAPTLPLDPFMIETPLDRTSLGLPSLANPVLGAPASLVPATSTDPAANPINGHEQIASGVPGGAASLEDAQDLQYACTFPLGQPRDCVQADAEGRGCDCSESELDFNRPLCATEGGVPTTLQTHAKGYPGTRFLEVLKGFGRNSIVASICPKISDDARVDHPDFGYNPAVAAIVNRLKGALRGRCLPRALAVDPETQLLQCVVVETTVPAEGEACSCDRPGRSVADARIAPVVLRQLRESGQCDGSTGTPCERVCACELQQATGPELEQCQTVADAASLTPGYCYLSEAPGEPPVPASDGGGPRDEVRRSLLKGCAADQKRLLRFVGSDTPVDGSSTFVACLGAPLGR